MQRFLWLLLLLLLLLLCLIRHSLFLFWSRYFCMSVAMGIALRARDSLWPKLPKSITASRELTLSIGRGRPSNSLPSPVPPLSVFPSACLSMNLVFLLRACNYSWARRGRGCCHRRVECPKRSTFCINWNWSQCVDKATEINILRNVSQYWNETFNAPDVSLRRVWERARKVPLEATLCGNSISDTHKIHAACHDNGQWDKGAFSCSLA